MGSAQDIDGRIPVGVTCETTVHTDKISLRAAIVLVHTTAGTASLAGIGGIDLE